PGGNERGGREPVRRCHLGPVGARSARVDEPVAGEDEDVRCVDYGLERLENVRAAARAVRKKIDELARHRQRVTGPRGIAAEVAQRALEMLQPEPERTRTL